MSVECQNSPWQQIVLSLWIPLCFVPDVSIVRSVLLFDIKTKRHIFQIHTQKMTLADDVNLESSFCRKMLNYQVQNIKNHCEAGMLALRERRMKVLSGFCKAKDKAVS